MRQTLAIFIDAYRELNAKRLFWIVMTLSFIVALAFATVTLTPNGIKVLTWEFDSPFNTGLIPASAFYKLIFVEMGIQFWLSWIATILALVSTAGMFPEFVSSGSIELVLSKPIGRLRLFLTKYTAGLLFVTLQVGAFSTASFFVIGIRGSAWEPGLFLAVPVVVLFFSYLFCICALIGLLTRSAIAAMLLTLLIWLGIFGVHLTESLMLTVRVQSEVQVERLESRAAALDERIASLRDGSELPEASVPEAPPGEPGITGMILWALRNAGENATNDEARRAALITGAESERGAVIEQLERQRGSRETWQKWHRAIFVIKTLTPKTSETTDLLKRWIISSANLDAFAEMRGGSARVNSSNGPPPPGFVPNPDVIVDTQTRVDRILRARSPAWIIGTSLLFEVFILGIAAWLFCRRDF